MEKAVIGIIGGSGLYDIEGSRHLDEIAVSTPWGEPSDRVVLSDIGGIPVAFLPRHGKGHRHLPHEVNFRANIAALKMLGVREIIAFSAVGSLKEEIKPLDFALPSQILDRTKNRQTSFLGDGVAGHISFGEPFCGRLQSVIGPAAKKCGISMHLDQTLICMEGPAFSTRAESNLYRSWGAGLINMSTLPEAKLAREAEICYSVICMTTDYDSWRDGEEHVTIEMVINNLNTNSDNAKKLIREIVPLLGKGRECACGEAMRNAVITAPDARNQEQVKKLKVLFPGYF